VADLVTVGVHEGEGTVMAPHPTIGSEDYLEEWSFRFVVASSLEVGSPETAFSLLTLTPSALPF
jgi:hypothetical protein